MSWLKNELMSVALPYCEDVKRATGDALAPELLVEMFEPITKAFDERAIRALALEHACEPEMIRVWKPEIFAAIEAADKDEP